MISKDTQTRIIRAYLGRFSVSVLKADQNKFLEMLGDSQSVFIKGPQMLLNQFICTVLMRKRVFHSYRTTYDTVQMFLGQNEDSPDFMDLTSGVLIIEHAKATVENKQLEPLNKQLISQRESAGLMTIVMGSGIPSIEQMCKVLNLANTTNKEALI